MPDGERGNELFGHSRQEFAVSLVGYVIGFVVVLFVLDLIGMLQRQPQQAFVLAIVVPLVPFLILLAFGGRIGAVRGPGGIEITFDGTVPMPADHESESGGTRPAPGRRTVLKLGALLTTAGAIWGLVSRRQGLNSLLESLLAGGGADTDPTPDGSPAPTTTAVGAATPTDSDAAEGTGASTLVNEYGERVYGQDEYGG